jgi:hypothetical protein
MPVILAAPEAEMRRILVGSSSPRQIVLGTLCGKYSTQSRAGGVIQVVECLPSKPEFKKKKKNPPLGLIHHFLFS